MLNKVKRSFVVIAALVAMVFAAYPVSAFAATEYYDWYADWVEEANGGENCQTWNEVVDVISEVLEAGKEAFDEGDLDNAYNAALQAYYGYYETTGFERIMNSVSGARVSEVELAFSNARSVVKKGGSYDEYVEACDTLLAMLRSDANDLDGVSGDESSDTESTSEGTGTSVSATGSALIFAGCFGIILREGFEAILVVGAIIAYLRVKTETEGTDKKKTLYPVYFGSLLGIVASFAVAFILNLLKLSGQVQQEMIEGVTALVAVCVLFYVSNWMLNKSETEAWQYYLQSKVESATQRGSVFALAFTAFLAVFREGAEVVLFFQPYLTEGTDFGSVWAGLILGAICLVFVYAIIHFLSVAIPLKPFFTATSILMAVMCVTFLGAGIKELIEAGVFNSTSPSWLQWIPYNDVLDILGIYPLLETLIPQIILSVILIVLFAVGFKKNKEIAEAARIQKEAEAKIAAAREAWEKEQTFRAQVAGVVMDVLSKAGLSNLDESAAEELVKAVSAVDEPEILKGLEENQEGPDGVTA